MCERESKKNESDLEFAIRLGFRRLRLVIQSVCQKHDNFYFLMLLFKLISLLRQTDEHTSAKTVKFNIQSLDLAFLVVGKKRAPSRALLRITESCLRTRVAKCVVYMFMNIPRPTLPSHDREGSDKIYDKESQVPSLFA